MRCEDYPCCGHEAGCCPDRGEDGEQLDMKCVCGASVPLTSHTSLCPSCLRGGSDYDGDADYREYYAAQEAENEGEYCDDMDDDPAPLEDFGYFGEMGMHED